MPDPLWPEGYKKDLLEDTSSGDARTHTHTHIRTRLHACRHAHARSHARTHARTHAGSLMRGHVRTSAG